MEDVRHSTYDGTNYVPLGKKKTPLMHPTVPTRLHIHTTQIGKGGGNLAQLLWLSSEKYRSNPSIRQHQTVTQIFLRLHLQRLPHSNRFSAGSPCGGLKASTLRGLINCATEARPPGDETVMPNVCTDKSRHRGCEMSWCKDAEKERKSRNSQFL